VTCSIYGDPHVVKQYNAGRPPYDLEGTGWHWLAKSTDGSFKAQGFIRQRSPGAWATLSHVVMKFGENLVYIDRDQQDIPGMPWKQTYYINGVKREESETPLEVGSLYWVNRAGKADADSLGQDVWEGSHEAIKDWRGRGRFTKNKIYLPTGHIDEEASTEDFSRLSCWESGQVSIWTAYEDWISTADPPGQWRTDGLNVPYGAPMLFDLEGSADFLDLEVGACGGQSTKVDPTEMIATVEQNEKACGENNLEAADCAAPDPPEIPLTAEQLCNQNDLDISHAQDLCADQQAHGDTILQDCIYDVCSSVDETSRLMAVAGAELEAATLNSEAKCEVNKDQCLPCTICATSTEVDLSNVVQNNLGGLGPDAGAEEIRYANAITLDGKTLDVVLTAESEYKTPKPTKNGAKGGFGIFTLKAKQSTDFKFSFVDSTSGAPVAVKDLAVTFYDMDEGKRGRQKESISMCSAQEVYTTSDTELVSTKTGSCRTYTSSARGTGKDNPQRPDELTRTQAARSVTFEFHSKASLGFTAAIGPAGRSPRPVMFSFKPQVACGAVDSDVQCDQ